MTVAETTDVVRIIGDLQKIEVRPGDRLVLTSQIKLSSWQRDRISAAFKELFPETPLIIMDDGMTLGVLTVAGRDQT